MVECGRAVRLEGDRIPLAGALDRALLRVAPARLAPALARWMLEDGWRESADGSGTAWAQAARSGILLPAPACGTEADGSPAVSLRFRAHQEPGMPLPEGAVVRLLRAGETIDEAVLDADGRGAVLQAGIGAASSRTEVRSDPPGIAVLEEIAAPLGRVAVVLDHEYRDGIVASSVREATFRVLVPPSAILRFAVAAVRTGPATGGAISGAADMPSGAGGWMFGLSADAGQGAIALWSEPHRAVSMDAARWHERTVDLAGWAGREIELTLKAQPGGEAAGLALWGSPIVEARRAAPGVAGAAGRRPNILLISVDTLRADRVGRTSALGPVTPHLDALAAEGVRFTGCRTQAPSTLYGHAAMLTGLPPSAHGVTPAASLHEAIPYVPALLGASGYATAAATDGGLMDGGYGFSRGFHAFRSRYEPVESKVDSATRKLRGMSGPWFFFLHTYEVHAPYDPPDAVLRRLSAGYAGPLAQAENPVTDIRTFQRVNNAQLQAGDEDIRYLESLYDAEVTRADAALGRLFADLKASGAWDDTVVVVTSDHGEEFGEHGVAAWHSLTCYDEVMRVPLIVKPAGRKRGGAARRVDVAVRAIDVAPTLLELAGLTAPAPMQGRSLAGLMRGEREPDRETLCEVDGANGAALLLDGWKYHSRTAESAADARLFKRRIALRGRYSTEELYHLDRDPLEQVNLAASEPDRARRMRETLEARLASMRNVFEQLAARGASPAPHAPRMDEEHARRLRALGYVQ